MRFADIRGNAQVKEALRGMADSGRVPHAILMHEDEGGGALPLAMAFLQYLNCREPHDGDSCGSCPSCIQTGKFIYPDTHFTFPITTGGKVSGEAKSLVCDNFKEYFRALAVENPYFLENELYSALGFEKKSGLISKAEGAAILKILSLSSISDGYRAVVMLLPEKMNQETANMLLKSIEEPAPKTLFILITHSPEDVLQTISSRCLHLRVAPLSSDEVAQALVERFSVEPSRAGEAALLSGGSVGVAKHSLEESEDMVIYRDLFMELIRSVLRRDLLGCLTVGETLSAIDSREKQKAFCKFAGESVRKMYMVRQGQTALARVLPSEESFIAEVAPQVGEGFFATAISVLDKAYLMLSRNVNQKILFTNMVDKLISGAR